MMRVVDVRLDHAEILASRSEAADSRLSVVETVASTIEAAVKAIRLLPADRITDSPSRSIEVRWNIS